MRGVIAAATSSARTWKFSSALRRHVHRPAARQLDDVVVADPGRRRDDHLVALVDQREHRVVDRLLGARADDHLARARPGCRAPCRSRSATALRSGTVPSTSVYFVAPASSAFLAASLMCAGVSKSGSPAPKLTTSIALGLELRRLGGDGQGGGRFDDGQPARELHGIDSLFAFFGERGDDARRHRARDISAHQRHFFHERGGYIKALLAGHQKQGLDVRRQAAVHVRQTGTRTRSRRARAGRG